MSYTQYTVCSEVVDTWCLRIQFIDVHLAHVTPGSPIALYMVLRFLLASHSLHKANSAYIIWHILLVVSQLKTYLKNAWSYFMCGIIHWCCPVLHWHTSVITLNSLFPCLIMFKLGCCIECCAIEVLHITNITICWDLKPLP